jgi:hypothetical protein
MKRQFLVLGIAAVLTCCAPDNVLVGVPQGDAGFDAGPDAGPDGGLDSGVDAGPDGGPDAGPTIPDGGCVPGTTQVCYTGPAGTVGVGICHAGTQACASSYAYGPCEDEQVPTAETCDCQDDDCNGTINDIYPGACYSGPTDTIGVGACDYGVTECTPECTQVCANEVTPEPDQCAGVDLECNGDPPSVSAPVDLVFMVDDTNTGCEYPMGQAEFNQVQDTLTTYGSFPTTLPAFIRWTLIAMPGCNGQGWPAVDDGGYSVFQELTDQEGFLVGSDFDGGIPGYAPNFGIEIQCYDTTPQCMSGYAYYPYDLLYEQVQGQLTPWSDGGIQRYIVMMTAQPGAGLTYDVADINAALAASPVPTTVLIFAEPRYEPDYEGIDADADDRVFALSDYQSMDFELQENIAFMCKQ